MTRLGVFVVGLALFGCGRGPFFEFDPLQEFAPDQDDPLADGCNEVDYLFVVDNSSSMGDNQHKLSQSVVDFVGGVESALKTVDSIHVGVITTDAYQHNTPGCDVLGGLVTQTGGHNSSLASCGPYAQGHNYMTEADDLQASIECATLVGTTGAKDERPLIATRAALEPELAEPGACNEGFVRPNALLVVVYVTDEDGFQGTGAYEALVEAKAGHDDNVVVVSIVHSDYETCSLGGHARIADNLIALTENFEHGVVSSICASDFSAPFAQATSVIERACGGKN